MSRVYAAVTILIIISTIAIVQSNEELRFVSVVFRHGDRAPDDNGHELYPNDPYLKDAFYPMGLGGLTNNGKLREYNLGKTLRTRYNNFLGNIYHPEDIDARSTNYDRTKMSLSLALAALYPPATDQRWSVLLNWQPIPTTYVERDVDQLLIPEYFPKYLEELERVKLEPNVTDQLNNFQPFMDNLTNYTGKIINDTNGMYYLYHTLMAEYAMDLPLPEWAQSIFPLGDLWRGTIAEYNIISYNKMLKKLNGGTLLKRMIDDMNATVHNTTKKAKKINLFSGHETNVAALLQTLGVYNPHVPQYSSAVFVELIKKNDIHYVQVLHYLGIPSEVKTLQIPDCNVLCPLDRFIELLKDVTPTKEELA